MMISYYSSETTASTDNVYYMVDATADTTTSTVTIGHSNTWGATYVVGGVGWYAAPETEEQRQAREAWQAQQAVAMAKEAERRRKAERKATKLFTSIVGAAAYKLFRRRQYHDVVGVSGTRYRLRPGRMIDVMDGQFGDRVLHRYCIIADYSYDLPAMDVMVAQLLLVLSGDEGEGILKKTANKHAVAA